MQPLFEKSVVLAPFANERVREWPIEQFRKMIELILKDGTTVKVVGTAQQRVRANGYVRGFPSDMVHNLCGRMSWGLVLETIRASEYIVANNSGLAHAAAAMGKWTLCLFGGAHSWIEWMPTGQRVVTVARMVRCAPCEIGGGRCPNGIACLSWLDAEVAYAEFQKVRSGSRAKLD